MRRLVSVAVLVAVTVGFSATPAFAKKKDKSPEATFAALDKNGDGKLSLEEYTAKTKPENVEKATAKFKKLDKNNDGFLSIEEFKAGQKAPPPPPATTN